MRDYLRAHVVPHEARRHALAAQKTIDGIVAHIVDVLGKVGQRAAGRARQQVLGQPKAAQMFRLALNTTIRRAPKGLLRFVTIRFRFQSRFFA
jgi:hypothetical protein